MRANRWLAAAVVLLVFVLAAQGAYILYLKGRLDGRQDATHAAARRPEVPVRATAPMVSRVPSAAWMLRQTDPFAHAEPDEWDPFAEMDRIQQRINRLFRESMSRSLTGGGSADHGRVYEPDVSARETADSYQIRLDLPGVEKSSINVRIQDRVLTVSGERRHERETEDPRTGTYQAESSFSSFHRSFPLPADADTQGLRAETRDGVLTVTLPKLKEPASNQEQTVPVQ